MEKLCANLRESLPKLIASPVSLYGASFEVETYHFTPKYEIFIIVIIIIIIFLKHFLKKN